MLKADNSNCIAPVGGQAVMEGVMMRGTHGMALAVRDADGDIALETYRLKGKKWYNKLPFLRGIVSFGSSLVLGMKMLSRSIEMSSSEDEQIGKGGMAFAMILGVLLFVGLFIALPEIISGLIRDLLLKQTSDSTKVLVHSIVSGVLRIIIFVLYLVLCSRLKDIKRTFMYHGAEHKTINCFEGGKPLTIENIKECSCVHRRCGTTFLFLVMVVSILLFALVNWLFVLSGLTFDDNVILQNLVRMAIKIALLPLVAGIAYEILRLFSKLPYNLFTKIIMAPGLLLQKLSTSEPDEQMIEVALASFNAAINMENDKNLPEIKFGENSYSQVRSYILEKLKEVDADEAEADWIFCHISGLKRSSLYKIEKIEQSDYKKIKEILKRRIAHEPLDYILGYSEFYGHNVAVNHNVLIPRMDTETLLEKTIEQIKQFEQSGKKSQDNTEDDVQDSSQDNVQNTENNIQNNTQDNACKVLDLCTGSGCLALGIAKQTNAKVFASDISLEALEVAKLNLKETNCTVIESDLFENISEKFDIIVSNPPYIKSGEIDTLQAEVTCQPKIALDGGEDGLEFYRKIIDAAPQHLNNNGVLLVEIGHNQANEVTTLLKKHFKSITLVKDLSGNDRVLIANKSV